MEIDITIAETGRAWFAGLAHRHEIDLMRLCLRLCRGSYERAEDLAQETLVRAYEAFLEGRFHETAASAWPWLRRIATNLFINDFNRRKRWEADSPLDDLIEAGVFNGPEMQARIEDTPGGRLLEETLDEDLERAIAMLASDLRRTVILVDMEAVSYEEAAKTLRVPIGTVRSRLSRARMKLHDLLQEFAKSRGYDARGSKGRNHE